MSSTETYPLGQGTEHASSVAKNSSHENESYFFETQPFHTTEGWAVARGVPVHWTAAFPEEPIFDGMWHFMNGFMAKEETSKAFLHAAASAGFATAIVDPIRNDNGNIFVRARDPQKAHAEAHQAAINDIRTDRKVKSKMPHGNRLDLARKVLLPHSMSGLTAPRLAEAVPGMVEGIVNLQAVGYSKISVRQIGRNMLTGMFGSVVHEFYPAIRDGNLKMSWDMARAEAQYVASDFSRTICEGNSCLTQSVTNRVARLMLERNIWVAYLAAKYDLLVPPDPSIEEHVDLYRVISNAGHMVPQTKPEKLVREIAAVQEELQAA